MAADMADKFYTLEEVRAYNYALPKRLAQSSPLNSVRISSKLRIGLYVPGQLAPAGVLHGKCGAGSEYAVLELAKALSKTGHNVYVFTHLNVEENWRYCLAGSNPQYLPIKNLPNPYAGSNEHITCMQDLQSLRKGQYRLDHLIVWRVYNGSALNWISPKVHFWSHDFAPVTSFNYTVDCVYALTEFHRDFLKEKLGDKYHYVVGCNGTSVNLNEPVVRRSGAACKRVCYASNYCRGLNQLLCIWPNIRKAVPDAELHIFYGRETWGCLTAEQIQWFIDRIQSLQGEGVIERCVKGMMPHMELLEEFKNMSILCYPYTGYSETFSIIAVAAQQQGCLTAVRRQHGLIETCRVQTSNMEELEEIESTVIRYLQSDEDELYPLRLKHREATKDYTWETAVRRWLQVFNK